MTKSRDRKIARTQDERIAMTRFDAIGIVCRGLVDEPVIASLGHPAYELFAHGDRALNFYTWGSMGLTSSIALGIALARPDRRVVALDGDGSLLMNLGSLATMAAAAPANLVVLVLDNEGYGTPGRWASSRPRRCGMGRGSRESWKRAGTGRGRG
jgi:thiamine pyrophosphate-dependent acetolactate synthase large subunit-like protein